MNVTQRDLLAESTGHDSFRACCFLPSSSFRSPWIEVDQFWEAPTTSSTLRESAVGWMSCTAPIIQRGLQQEHRGSPRLEGVRSQTLKSSRRLCFPQGVSVPGEAGCQRQFHCSRCPRYILLFVCGLFTLPPSDHFATHSGCTRPSKDTPTSGRLPLAAWEGLVFGVSKMIVGEQGCGAGVNQRKRHL